jgi:DNA-binding NtrC family response regulator
MAEQELILDTLDQLRGNKPEAAALLGISLKTLYSRLNLYRARGVARRAGGERPLTSRAASAPRGRRTS